VTSLGVGGGQKDLLEFLDFLDAVSMTNRVKGGQNRLAKEEKNPACPRPKPNPHRTSGKDAFPMMFLPSKKDCPADLVGQNVFVPVRYFHC
jgi:hypothetical protein